MARTPRRRAEGQAAMVAAALCALTGCDDSDSSGETFAQPPELRSADGELRTTFTVAESTVRVAGKSVRTLAYDDAFMPPLLRVNPGDTLHLDLNNQTGEPTNEHYHGMNVSPRINADATISDNVLISVEPGTQVTYRIQIPPTHNPGLYWYHAHLHGMAERQVMGGLSGGLIVEGVLDPFPELEGIRERVLLLKDVQITPQGLLPDEIDPGGETNRTVNGLTQPTIELPADELQFWRFANIGADMYYRLVLDGHVFYELARDAPRTRTSDAPDFDPPEPMTLYVWTAQGSAQQGHGPPLVRRYIAAIDAQGVVSTGHSALEVRPDVYISHYPAVEIDHAPDDFAAILRAGPENDIPGRWIPDHATGVRDWVEPDQKVVFEHYDAAALRAFWDVYRQDSTYNLTSRSCSTATSLAIETALEGVLGTRRPLLRFVRLLLDADVWLAAALRRRGATMAWTPGLVLDYARLLRIVVARHTKTGTARLGVPIGGSSM